MIDWNEYQIAKADNKVTLVADSNGNVTATFPQYDPDTGELVGSMVQTAAVSDVEGELSQAQANVDNIQALLTDMQAAVVAAQQQQT